MTTLITTAKETGDVRVWNFISLTGVSILERNFWEKVMLSWGSVLAVAGAWICCTCNNTPEYILNLMENRGNMVKCLGVAHDGIASCSVEMTIAQFWYIKIQPNTVDFSMRFWGISPTNFVVIPQSLTQRLIVSGWILISVYCPVVRTKVLVPLGQVCFKLHTAGTVESCVSLCSWRLFL